MGRRVEPMPKGELPSLVSELAQLQQRAVARGLFVDDRDLLKCPACGLLEDVLIGGGLTTYWDGEADQADSGLRFTEVTAGVFACPSCGHTQKLSGAAPSTHRPDRS